jgi:mercuric ion binding protein
MKMKTTALTLIGMLNAAPLFATEQTVTFNVPGMSCPSCPYIIEAAMGDVDGVLSVMADSDMRTARVVFDDDVTSPGDIAGASASAGYEATLVEGES